MNGTGLNAVSTGPFKHSLELQLKLSLVSSALARCTFAPEDLSHGNGMTKFDFSLILNSD